MPQTQTQQARENIQNARAQRHAKEDEQMQLWLQNRKERKSRSPRQQLEKLDFRLDKSVGAKRERKKLMAAI